MRTFTYEYDLTDGLWHMLMFGRRNRGFRPFKNEADARFAVLNAEEESRQADMDEIRYHVQ